MKLDRLIDNAVRYRRWVIAVYFVMAMAMLPGVMSVRQNNSPEVFFVRDATALRQYEDFEFTFGRDRTLRVVLEGEAIWTREGLGWIAEFERKAPKLRGVIGAAGLYGHHGFRFDQWPPADPGAFRAEVTRDPLDRAAAWVNEGGNAVTILVALYRLSPADQQVTLLGIEQELTGAPPGIRVSMVGLPEVNRAMDRAFIDILVVYFPLLLLLAVVILAVSLRQASQVLLPLMPVAICMVIPFGLMGYLEVRLNLVMAILLPLLFVISLATAVHVLMCFRKFKNDGRGTREAVIQTYLVKRWPVIWTGITTGAGFGSLTVSAVPPVHDLGLWSLLSIAIMTIAMLTLYPALLAGSTGRPGPDAFERWARRRGERWAAWSVQRPNHVFLMFSLCAAALLAGTPLLHVESNVLSYFDAAHPMRVELRRQQQNGIGVIAAELVLVRPVTDGDANVESRRRFDLPAELNKLADLGDEIRSLDLVLGGISAGDQVRGVSHYRSPGDHLAEVAVREALEFIRQDPEKNQMLAYLLSADADQARISMLVPMLGFNALEPVFENAKALARERFPDARVLLTGQYPLVLAAQKTLLQTMIISLMLTLLCIALIFRWVLGSSQLMVRALLPNLWPVAFVLGVLGWFDVPLDSTTVMIAAAILGLSVDDTLHSLGNFRRMIVRQTAARAAISTLKQTAPAHMLTSLILAAGFAVLSTSAFLPVARLGRISALAILAALLADLLLVPALLAASSAAAIEKLKPARSPGQAG